MIDQVRRPDPIVLRAAIGEAQLRELLRGNRVRLDLCPTLAAEIRLDLGSAPESRLKLIVVDEMFKEVNEIPGA